MIDGTPFSNFGARAEVTELISNKNSRVATAPDSDGILSESPSRHVLADRHSAEESRLPVAVRQHYTQADFVEAETKAILCEKFLALRELGFSGNQAAWELKKPASWFSVNVPAYQREGSAAFLPERRNCGAKATVLPELPAWFIPAARFFYLQTNRSRTKGSTPEALRRTISLPNFPTGWTNKERAKFLNYLAPFLKASSPHPSPLQGEGVGTTGEVAPECPEAIREIILAREKAGKPMLTKRLLRQISAGELAVSAHRGPRRTWLEYVQSPGSLQLTVDEITGAERYIEPGEFFTIDDATKNFPCVVEGLAKHGDKCFDTWGVMVARFQFILVVDHATYAIVGFNHTARPRSSYRAEDLTATLQVTMMEHGAPRAMIMEKGISAANLVSETLSALNVRIIRASSPHQKVVEKVFDKLWTKLAVQFPSVDVGRFMGEGEEASRLLEACRTGAHDPRKFFPTLAATVTVLREVIAEHNATPLDGRYGNWIPGDRFNRDAAKQLRPLNPAQAWMFSPIVTQPLKVNKTILQTSVTLLPGYSQKFSFNIMEIANEFFGATVKLFFNPFAPECVAKLVLAEEFRGHKSGEVLGDAVQFDREARYSRRWLQYSEEADIGRAETRKNAQAVHRYSQAVRPGRAESSSITEARDGAGNASTVEISTNVGAPVAPTPVGASHECISSERQMGGSFTTRTARGESDNHGAVSISRDDLAEKAEVTRRFEEENAHLFL